MLKVASAPVNWNSIDLPEHEQDFGYPEILSLAREAGYTAFEYTPAFGIDPERLTQDAAAHGITWCGSYHPADLVSGPLDDAQRQAVDDLASLLAAIGCRDLIAADAGSDNRIAIAGQVPEDGSKSLPADRWPLVAENLHEIGAIARKHGLRTHFHNHVGTWVETPAELDALLEYLDVHQVDLCFDTGHYAYGGGAPLAFLRENLSRVGYIHLKDVDAEVLVEARKNRWSFHDALRRVIFSPLGDGSARIPAILETLDSGGFAGWVVVEQDTCHGDPTAVARRNRLYIEQHVGVR